MRPSRSIYGLLVLAGLAGTVQAQYPYYPYQQAYYGYGYPTYPQASQAYSYPRYPYPQQSYYYPYGPQTQYPAGQYPVPQYAVPQYGAAASFPPRAYPAPASVAAPAKMVVRQASPGQATLMVLPEPVSSPNRPVVTARPVAPARPKATNLAASPAAPLGEKFSGEVDLGPHSGSGKTSANSIPRPLPSKNVPAPKKGDDSTMPLSELLRIPASTDTLILDGAGKSAPCCDKCVDACGNKEDHHPYCYAMAGFLFLQPRWQDNPAFFTLSTVGGVNTTGNQDFRYDWNFAPQVEAGFAGAGGLGLRGRYWHFDELDRQTVGPASATSGAASAAPLGLSIALAAAGDTMTANSRLFLHVADLELAQDIWVGQTLLKFGGGVQYTHLGQRYSAARFDAAGTQADSLFSSQRLNGVGPTIFLDGVRQWSRTGWGVYGRARGSLLFTANTQDVTLLNAGGGITDQLSRPREDTLPVLELEAGVQYTHPIGRANLFLRAGGNGQAWFGAGNSSDTSSADAFAFDPNANSHQDLTFLGLSVMAGVQY